MLDKLPAWQRHLSLLLIAAVLTWGLDNVSAIPDPIIASLAGALLTALTAYVTPLTRQYGVGSAPDISK